MQNLNNHRETSGGKSDKILVKPKTNSNLKKAVNKTDKLLKKVDYGQYDDMTSYLTGTSVENSNFLGRVPVRSFSKRDEEEYLSNYAELQDAAPGIFEGLDPNDFFEYIKTRDDENEELQFEKYLLTTFEATDPYQNQRLHDLFPQVAHKRVETIENNAKRYKHLVKMWIYGAETPEDFALTYKIDIGEETFNAEVLKKILGMDSASIAAADEGSTSGVADNHPDNRNDLRGDGNAHFNFASPFTFGDDGLVKINRKPNVGQTTVDSFNSRMRETLNAILIRR